MRVRFFRLLIFFLFLCVSKPIFSQQEERSVLLKDYILTLEKKYSVKFTYLESYVNILITKPASSENTLEAVLVNLQEQTKLNFEKTDKRNILIRPFLKEEVISVCGFILNKKRPLQNVTIQSALSLDLVTTNGKGYFELKDIPYNTYLVIRYEGQFLKEIAANSLIKKHKCQNISVKLPVVKLKEVVISNYLTKGFKKTNQVVSFKPSQFSVISGLTEPDILQGLQQIPGVQSPFESASKIYVRGGLPDQNLVLWNGIKTYNQSHFFGLISAFNPSLVDEVQFYNKGVPSKFGDRVAGVVDINSSKKVASKFKAGVGTNLIHADAYAQVPIIKDKLSVSVSGRRSFTDLWESFTYDRLAERVFQNTKIQEGNSIEKKNTFYFVDYTVGLQAKLSSKDNIQLNTFLSQNKLNFLNQQETQSQSDNLRTQSEGYSLQWQHKYNSFLSQQTKLYLSNYLLDYDFESKTSNSDLKQDTKQNFINDVGIQTYFDVRLTKKSKLQLGYEGSENEIRYSFSENTKDFEIELDADKKKLNTHSFFAEYELKNKNNYLFQIGLRANDYSTSNSLIFEPRIYLQKRVVPKVDVNIAFAKRSQAITQVQESVISSLTLENLIWRVADGDFDIIKTDHLSTGISYKSNTWFVELESYVKNNKNITTLTSGFINQLNAINEFSTGQERVVGSELFVKKKFGNYSTWLSYNYNNQKSKFKTLNKGVYFTSNININHTFKWLHFYNLKRFQFSLSWLLHTGKATTKLSSIQREANNGFSVKFNELNEGELPVYHKLDFSALYDFKSKKDSKVRYRLGLSVQNVYNRRTTINQEFRVQSSFSNELQTINYRSLGFTPNLSFRVFWD